MFVFAFEGELLAFTYNGDMFVLLALLPRRKPRTDGTVQPPYHSMKELNLTSSRLLRFACPIWRLAWISVSSMRGRISTLCRQIAIWGLPDKKPRPPRHRDDLGFRFFHPPTALWRYLHPSFQSGPRCRAGFRFRPSLRSGSLRFIFSVGSLASLVTGVYVSGFCNRCRSRCTGSRPRAKRQRSRTTGTRPCR